MAENRHELYANRFWLRRFLEDHPAPLPQHELARLCRRTQATVSHWYTGKSPIPEWAKARVMIAHGTVFRTREERLRMARHLCDMARERTRDLMTAALEWVENIALALEEEQQSHWLLEELERHGDTEGDASSDPDTSLDMTLETAGD